MPAHRLEQGCVYLCQTIEEFALWGIKQPTKCSGLEENPGFAGVFNEHTDEKPTSKLGDINNSREKDLDERWTLLKTDALALFGEEAIK